MSLQAKRSNDSILIDKYLHILIYSELSTNWNFMPIPEGNVCL